MAEKMMTPQEWHAELVKKFDQHLESVYKGEQAEYTFLAEDGIEYNGWIEHRNGWPVTEDLLCGVSLASVDDRETDDYGLEVPFEECATCLRLVEMYRDYCMRQRLLGLRRRRERAALEEDES